jgi:hypothetical protein
LDEPLVQPVFAAFAYQSENLPFLHSIISGKAPCFPNGYPTLCRPI